jgi:hypothetical protein
MGRCKKYNDCADFRDRQMQETGWENTMSMGLGRSEMGHVYREWGALAAR